MPKQTETWEFLSDDDADVYTYTAAVPGIDLTDASLTQSFAPGWRVRLQQPDSEYPTKYFIVTGVLFDGDNEQSIVTLFGGAGYYSLEDLDIEDVWVTSTRYPAGFIADPEVWAIGVSFGDSDSYTITTPTSNWAQLLHSSTPMALDVPVGRWECVFHGLLTVTGDTNSIATPWVSLRTWDWAQPWVGWDYHQSVYVPGGSKTFIAEKSYTYAFQSRSTLDIRARSSAGVDGPYSMTDANILAVSAYL
jgi:hypothetical protein